MLIICIYFFSKKTRFNENEIKWAENMFIFLFLFIWCIIILTRRENFGMGVFVLFEEQILVFNSIRLVSML